MTGAQTGGLDRGTVAAAAGCLALLSLLLVVRVPGNSLWLQVTLNASHGPVFAVVAILVWRLLPPAAHASGVAYVHAFFVAVGLGVVVEILQTLANRPGSSQDVLTDAAGAAAGLGLWALLRGRTARGEDGMPRRGAGAAGWALSAVLVGVAIVAWDPLRAARAYAHRAAIFPTIAEFRGPLDLVFVTTDGLEAAVVDLPEPWASPAGESALRLGYDPQHRPAVQVVEPMRDWRGHSVLAVDLTNPGEVELELTLRILDAAHDWTAADRLNLPLVIPPRTRAAVRVSLDALESAPAARPMDLSRIVDVMLFGRPPQAAGALYVSRIWLE